VNHRRTFKVVTLLSVFIVVGNFLTPYYLSTAESNDSGFWSDWCHITASPEDSPVCFQSYEECKKAESSDLFKSDDCFKHKS